MNPILSASIALAIAVASADHARASYSISDGTIEFAVGGVNSTVSFANQFNAGAGDVIASIHIAFGRSFGGPPLVGSPVTVNVWSDPNQNGLPDDATLLSSSAGVIATANIPGGPATYDTFLITPTPVVGSFFIGFTMNAVSGQFPGGLDTSFPLANRSFINVGGDIMGAGTVEAAVGIAGNWMIQANIPGPGAIALFALAGAVGQRRRRA